MMPAPASLAIHLDAVGGIAGDMFVAALCDAVPALEAVVLDATAAVQPTGLASPAFVPATSGGFSARRFALASAGKTRHEGHGTAYAELRKRISAAPLSAPTRSHALALLALLAEAEANVHGIAIDDVHFHELADWDSLLDVVAAGAIAGALEGARWSASTLPLGSGTVPTAHGALPVPAPATLRLLEGYPWHDDGIPGERVTPTGAAIVRHLVPVTACGAGREGGRLIATGYGAGTRELASGPNVLRAVMLERTASTNADAITVLEFDIDDMTGEEIGAAADRLRAVVGVIDVSMGSRAGKKGRPLSDFRLLVRPDALDEAARACFAETSTLGLRVHEERRRILGRTEVATTVASATVNVKIAERPGAGRTAKAAHDDVADSPELGARRSIRTAAEKRALDLDE
jgi:uncharacterized protein (TIGR00299 family) protein